MSTRQIVDWYDNSASMYNLIRPNDFLMRELNTRIIKKIKCIQIPMNSKAIDLGSGTGEGSLLVLDNLPHITFLVCADFSLQMLKFTKRKFLKLNNLDSCLINSCNCDVSIHPFKKNSFDFAISILCLHFLKDFKKGMSTILDLLSPGAKFYFILFGEEEFHKTLLQEFIPTISSKWNLHNEHENMVKFPSMKLVTESMKNSKLINLSIYEYKRRYTLRTFQEFMWPLDSRHSYWKQSLSQVQLRELRGSLLSYFRKECNDNGFMATLHSITIEGEIKK